jgi:hypothetical protein
VGVGVGVGVGIGVGEGDGLDIVMELQPASAIASTRMQKVTNLVEGIVV